jgi:hypothetical protein
MPDRPDLSHHCITGTPNGYPTPMFYPDFDDAPENIIPWLLGV